MILTEVGPITAYRMHTPKWASIPKSGAGAAEQGGRINRPGTPALYLSLEPETARREYQQLSPLMPPPGTLVSYTVKVGRIVDFRGGYEPVRWAPLWEEFSCDWRQLWFNRHVEPPSWALADEVLAGEGQGVLFASTIAVGGTNLVLYTDLLTAADQLDVYDPSSALPKNQDSWR